MLPIVELIRLDSKKERLRASLNDFVVQQLLDVKIKLPVDL